MSVVLNSDPAHACAIITHEYVTMYYRLPGFLLAVLYKSLHDSSHDSLILIEAF